MDHWKPGCYLRTGKSFGFYVSYGGFHTWQNALSLIVHGVPSGEVVENPKRFEGQPFVELIHFPGVNNVGIGPKTSAKLYKDFVSHAARVKKGFQRLTAEPVTRSKKAKRKSARSMNRTAALAQSLANAIGGMAVGGDDDPSSGDWEWKWEIYRDFRRAFKLARDSGIVILSI